MSKTKQQQLEETTDTILRGAKPAVHEAGAAQGERAGRRRDLTLFELSLDRIRPDPGQVRRVNKAIHDPEIKELAASIKDKGVLQPLAVRYVPDRDHYQLVAGERRYTAAKLAGLQAVPVKLLDVADKDARVIQLIENIHRADLLPTELGAALRELRADGQSVEDLARLLRKSVPYIRKALGIAENLAPKIQREARAVPERLQSMEHLYELSKLPPERQAELWKEIKEKGLTSRQVRQVTAEVTRQTGPARPERGGRPAGSKPYSKTLTTEVGARVIIRFSKTRVTTEEVVTALRQAIQLLSQ